ncbi:MAG TPA: hypothetical protein VK563_18800 [Puia sp.]|nr:hypothetical protein [Puia sp.]
MRPILVLLFLLFVRSSCDAQFLKDLGNKAKDEVEYRVRRKAGQKIDEGLDKALDLPRKIKINKHGNEPGTPVVAAQSAQASQPGQPTSLYRPGQSPQSTQSAQPGQKKKDNKRSPATPPAGTKDEGADDLVAKDGFITLSLSMHAVFPGTSLRFSGESVKQKQFTSVEITVTGPSTHEVKTVTLNAEGAYTMDWVATDNTGEYTVTVKSSDKKAEKTEPFTVEGLNGMETWGTDNIEETNKAYDNLKDQVERTEGSVSAKDKAELEKKLNDVRSKVDDLIKLFTDLNKAGKATSDLVKKGIRQPATFTRYLPDLNNTLATHAREMQSFNRLSKHEPFDNTICEYLVMINEACAAFSTITNVATLNIGGILKNIALDKVVPKLAGDANKAAGGNQSDFALQEATKMYATSKIDAESMLTKMGQAGLAGDLLQFASSVLLKIYCGTFSGDIQHDYTINFRNSDGLTWWKYGVKMKGSLSLRYPKKGAESGIIKMKGSIEGNATNFTFFQNVAIEESFNEGSKGKIEVVELKVLKPATFPFVSSQADKLGFGAAARTLVTPASFYIPVDAEYDPDNDKIKITINSALWDFTPLVKNTFIFLLIGGDLLPYIKKMDFPIHSAERTLRGNLLINNEFTMYKDEKGNPYFSDKRNRHIGSPSAKIETDLNLDIQAKKD